MTSRTALFGIASEKGDDNEKLVELFKNRAELKKEFAELRKEQYRLKDRIKEQKGATARIAQKLEHLENLMLDPEWVHTVVVFYQLRGLNLKCLRKLEKFAEQLKQQREQRQHGRLMESWAEQQRAQAAEFEERLGKHRLQTQTLEDQLQAERHKINSMSGLAKVFKGKAASTGLDDLLARIEVAQQGEQELLRQYEEIRNREPPDAEGLDVAAKRSINFMILSFAQQLYLHFCEDGLASLAKEAADKSVGAINYGSKDDCDVILQRILDRGDSFEKVTDFADVLQRRSKLIAEHAVFEKDGDAVPAAGTVATVFAIDAGGAVRERDANLLGDGYWNLAKILSR